jgi:TetR/AcrR family transcriptional repressor of mexJK operon
MKSDTQMETNTRPGRPKSEQKRAAILEAASELFLTRGLAATAMDAVAERARVSKQTVYSHFASKEDLYRTCITQKVAAYGFDESELPVDAELETALLAIGNQFLDLIFDDEVVAMFRVVIGESAAHHKIAELFFENGPGKTIRKIAGFMGEQMHRGLLREDDPGYVATLFLTMLRGNYQMQLLMSIKPDFDAESRTRHIRKVVDQFLVLYGA